MEVSNGPLSIFYAEWLRAGAAALPRGKVRSLEKLIQTQIKLGLKLELVSATASRFGSGAGRFAATAIAALVAMAEAVDLAVQVREEIADRRRTAALAAAVVASRSATARGFGGARRFASGSGTSRSGTSAGRFGGGAGRFTARGGAAIAAHHAIKQTGLGARTTDESGDGDQREQIRLHGEDSCSYWETNTNSSRWLDEILGCS